MCVFLSDLPPLEVQPVDLRLFPGQTALFSCLVDGQPRPLVSWLKDSRPLVLDETRMTILPSGTTLPCNTCSLSKQHYLYYTLQYRFFIDL